MCRDTQIWDTAIPEGYGAIERITKQMVYLNSKISESSRNGPGEELYRN